MAPERWQQISQIFKVALEHEPAQRRAVLTARCDGDSGLCGEVEALLASYSDFEELGIALGPGIDAFDCLGGGEGRSSRCAERGPAAGSPRSAEGQGLPEQPDRAPNLRRLLDGEGLPEGGQSSGYFAPSRAFRKRRRGMSTGPPSGGLRRHAKNFATRRFRHGFRCRRGLSSPRRRKNAQALRGAVGAVAR